MYSRWYCRTKPCLRFACDLLPDATASSFRNMNAVGCRFFATKSQGFRWKSLTNTSLSCGTIQPAAVCRSFSTSHKKLKLDSMQPVAPHALNTGKLSDVQSNAADDMKVADIDVVQDASNSLAENITDDAQTTTDSGKYLLSFKCKPCDHRMMRFISKQAYRKGIVIVRCESCAALHLMADNLGWFKTSTGYSTVNVEQLLAAKGETVRKALSDLGPDDIKVLQDNMDIIIDVPDSLRAHLSQQKPV